MSARIIMTKRPEVEAKGCELSLSSERVSLLTPDDLEYVLASHASRHAVPTEVKWRRIEIGDDRMHVFRWDWWVVTL